MSRGRGESKNIKNGVQAAILYVKIKHANWSDSRIREYLLTNHSRFNLEKADIPVVRSINNVINRNQPTLDKMKAIANTDTFKALDAPWHMGLTGQPEYNLPAAAVAAIFEVQFWLEKVKDKPNTPTTGITEWTESFTNGEMTTEVWPVTIREALWIAKLYKARYVLSEPERLYILTCQMGIKTPKNPTNQQIYALYRKAGVPLRRTLIENPHKLWEAAKTYADYQRLCELAGTDFDTSRLDEALRIGILGRTKYELFTEYKAIKEAKNNERSHSTTE